jgi:hypothetical protein
LKPISGNHFKDCKYSNPTEPVGGKKEKWKIESKLGGNLLTAQPQIGEETVKREYEIRTNFNVDEITQSRIDNNKLIVSLHVDRTKYETHKELYTVIKKWWIETKNRSEKTIIDRLRHARSMQNYKIYPVNWIKFEPEQILNQLLYRQIYENKECAKETGNPTYGATQLHNLWGKPLTCSRRHTVSIFLIGVRPRRHRRNHKLKLCQDRKPLID